jgi:CHASE2 domain-containing sensor protein
MKSRPELFEILLSPIEGNPTKFKVVVTQSPSGEGSVESELPFFENEKDRRSTLLRALEINEFAPKYFDETEQNWLAATNLLLPDRTKFCPSLAENIGNILYKTLFPIDSQTEELLLKSIQLAKLNESKLLVQLKFEPDSVQIARLPDYPWELIHDGIGFLLHDQASLSRYIAFPSVPPKFSPVEKINVLLISSSISDEGLGIQKLSQEEHLAVKESLKDAIKAGRVDLKSPEKPTFSSLAEYLTKNTGKKSPHILHFDGHGFFGKRCTGCKTLHKGIKSNSCQKCSTPLPEPEGYLIFENDDGNAEPVSASQLGTLLRQKTSSDGSSQNQGVAVVVLSACQSGMAVDGKSIFRGAAQRLIYHGIPAVVAMQYSVRVEESVQFSKHFYRSIGEKNSLAVAVSLGRTMMGVNGNQWYRPVLYLRWKDNEGGQLFHNNSRLSFKEISVLSITSTTLIMILRWFGFLQAPELWMFDQLMRSRPPESLDNRIVIVKITDDDLNNNGGYPLSDVVVTKLLSRVQSFKPRVVGLDLHRYKQKGKFGTLKDREDFIKQFDHKNLLIVCSYDKSKSSLDYAAPNEFWQEKESKKQTISGNGEKAFWQDQEPQKQLLDQLAFSDFTVDRKISGEIVRRQTIDYGLEYAPPSCQTSYSFSALLVSQFFEAEGKSFDLDSNQNWKLGNVVFKSLDSRFAGYQQLDGDSNQILVNYRSGQLANEIELTKALNNLNPESIRDKIVLIGYDDSSSKDSFETSHGKMPGVKVHAHMVSQMLNAILNNRPLIWVLPNSRNFQWGDAIFIDFFSCASTIVSFCWVKKKYIWFFTFIGSFVFLYLVCWGSLIQGCWMPLLPSVISMTAVNLSSYLIVQSRKSHNTSRYSND